MTLEEFLDEWHRQANEYGASLTRDQRDIAEQAWDVATAAEREACAQVCENFNADHQDCNYYDRAMAAAIRARGAA